MRNLFTIVAMLFFSVSAAAASPDVLAACEKSDVPEFSAIIPLDHGDWSAYRVAEPLTDTPFELHVIGSYNGSGRVLIGPTDRPVVLFLSSYESSRWQIELAEGARLARVLAQSSDGSLLVTGLPDGFSIENLGRGPFAEQWQADRSGTQYMPGEFKEFIAYVRCKSGQVETSFQGSHELGDMFTVPPVAVEMSASPIKNPGEPRSSSLLDATATIEEYAAAITKLPDDFAVAGAVILSLIEAGNLPVFFPSGDSVEDTSAPAILRPLWFPSDELTVRIDADLRECSGQENAAFIGTPDAETFACAWGNQWYALGAGGDVVDDSWGDDVFIAGKGDQIVDLGWGNDIALFQSGWGSAVVGKTCHNSTLTVADQHRLNWHYDHTNFLIFGPDLHPSDFAWSNDRVLTHRPTGDRIELTDDCFTIVFSEPGEAPKRN